jgi:hypothetical protein
LKIKVIKDILSEILSVAATMMLAFMMKIIVILSLAGGKKMKFFAIRLKGVGKKKNFLRCGEN